MRGFFEKLTTEWWGITLIVVVAVVVWVLLSALLYRQFFKRFYDVLLSGVALVVLSPILIVLTIVGAVKMKGNPFFTQQRPGKIGKDGKEKIFRLIKFRTMTCERDAEGNLLPDEQRLTSYGKILRSTSLDELPELVNVFLGEMSLVGPRPLLVKDLVFMSDEIRARHKVRGGITGVAQVCGRNNITWEQKFSYDLEYVRKITLWQDIKIMLMTIFKVLKRSDVVRDGTASDIDYGDWLMQEMAVTKEEYVRKMEEVNEWVGG